MFVPIKVAAGPAGSLIYRVPLPPESLPAVAPDDLISAWALARQAADAGHWGAPRHVVFEHIDGAPTEITIIDDDASAWADALDAAVGLGSLDGLALCLRLLALIEVLGREPRLRPLFDLTPEGIVFDPRLLRAAATLPLDAAARFDAARLGGLLSLSSPT
jgi:hypothetical protein